jgi:hypothetical protein
MAGSITNEFNFLPSLGASTDWVLTFPTKRFYVDKQLYPSTLTLPFSEPFAAPGASLVTAGIGRSPLDHDGYWALPLCPGVPGPTCLESFTFQRFRYEVNVIPFAHVSATAASKIFGSMLFPPYDNSAVSPRDGQPQFGAGWVHLDFPVPGFSGALGGGQRILSSGARVAIELEGAPVTGFMAYNIVNANAAPGMLANYGGIFAHRTGAAHCTGNTGACASP